MSTEETSTMPPQGILSRTFARKRLIALIVAVAVLVGVGGVVGYNAYTTHQAHQKALTEYEAAVDAYTSAVDELAPAADQAQSAINGAAETLKSNDAYRRTHKRSKELTAEAEKYHAEKPSALTLDVDVATTQELIDAAAGIGVATKDVQDIVSGLKGISNEIEKLLAEHHLNNAKKPYNLATSSLQQSITLADHAYRDADGRVSDNAVRDELKAVRDRAETFRKELVNWRSENPDDYVTKTEEANKHVNELNAHIKKVHDAMSAYRLAQPLPTFNSANDDTSDNTWTPQPASPTPSNDWTPTPSPNSGAGNNGGWVVTEDETGYCGGGNEHGATWDGC